MKLMVCGHGRHGKDQFCEFLRISYKSSSEVALDEAVWDAMALDYDTKTACFEDRHNRRAEWHRLIAEYNTPDLTKLAKVILSKNDVYCGIRSKDEFLQAKRENLFDLSIWVDASERLPPESSESCSMSADLCDVVVQNNGTLGALEDKAVSLRKALGLDKQVLKDVITQWADKEFPGRTVTNAIHKLVLEELPEFLTAQHDELELADCAILIEDIAYLSDIDLEDAMHRKMEINTARDWAIDPITGLMSHVEEL